MRLRSDIVVSALIRRVFSLGGYAAVESRGADAAGAIFIRQRFRDGTQTLYAPAPQMVFDEESDGDRLFEKRLDHTDDDTIATLLARERKFDSDLWIVEIETDDISNLIRLATP